jgi:hypothetical protein
MSRNLPFQKLDSQRRINLALFAALIFYLMQFGLALYTNNLFNTLGSDFLGFWTTGYIANTQGYPHIYDADLVSKIQKPYHEVSETDNIYAPILTAFFPVFGLPFQFLALLQPKPAFAIWSFLNLTVLVFYLNFFIKDLTHKRIHLGLLALLAISYPVFHNTFWGQTNVWLLVCIGEFMRALRCKKPFIGGLWLAGMLAKPQTLILLIPTLIIKRSWRAVAGFTAGMLAITTLSFILAGTQGLNGLMNVWFGFASGIPTNAPEHMVSWRMIMVQLNVIANSNISKIITIIGISATLLASFFIWPKSDTVCSREFPAALLGFLASTAAVTWHSHVHMMLVLFPPLAYLAVQNRIPSNIINFWSFGPPITLMLSYSCLIFAKFNLLPEFGYEGFFFALWGFIFNLSILAWIIKTRNQPSNDAI